MSLRWTSYIAPNLPSPKVHFTWRKSATKMYCVNTLSDKVIFHSLAYLSMQKSVYQIAMFFLLLVTMTFITSAKEAV